MFLIDGVSNFSNKQSNVSVWENKFDAPNKLEKNAVSSSRSTV